MSCLKLDEVSVSCAFFSTAVVSPTHLHNGDTSLTADTSTSHKANSILGLELYWPLQHGFTDPDTNDDMVTHN